MIKLPDGELRDLLPSSMKNSVDMICYSYTLKKAAERLLFYEKTAMVQNFVDSLPEMVLDVLADELCSPYYYDHMDLDDKRKIIKNTLRWHLRTGTVGALDHLLKLLYGNTISISEWFEYGGNPYCFRILFNIIDYASDVLEVVRAIQLWKRCSAHLDSVIYKYTTRGNVGIKSYTKFGDSIKVKPKTIKNINADAAKSRADAVIFEKNELKIKPYIEKNMETETHLQSNMAVVKNDIIYINAKER